MSEREREECRTDVGEKLIENFHMKKRQNGESLFSQTLEKRKITVYQFPGFWQIYSVVNKGGKGLEKKTYDATQNRSASLNRL